MNEQGNNRTELALLIGLLCADSINPEEMARLETLLLDDPEAQRFYHEYVALDVELSWTSLVTQPATSADCGLPNADCGLKNPLPIRNPQSAIRNPKRRRLLSVVVTMCALAAAVLVAVLFWQPRSFRPDPPAESTGQARVVELFGDANVLTLAGDLVPLVRGQEIELGQILSTGEEDSFVTLRYPDSTRLELSANTKVQIPGRGQARAEGGKRVFVFQGFLRVELPATPQGPPLILANEQVEVAAGASKLSFWTSREETRIESEEGQLQLRRRSDGKAVEVRGGSYTVISTELRDMQPRPLPTRNLKPRAEFEEGTGPVLALAFTPGGEFLITGGWKGQVKFWDPTTGTLVATPLEAHKQSVRSVVLTSDGKLMATAANERERLKLWDTGSRVQRALLKGQRANSMALAFAPNSTLLAAVGGNNKGGEVKLWDAAARTVKADLSGHGKPVLAAAFSPDGTLLATAGRDATIRLWDVATGKELHTIHAGQRVVWALAFAPDGTLLASGGQNGTIKFWDPALGVERLGFKAYPRMVKSLAFAPDGRTLAAAGDHPTVKLFDPASGQELTSFRGHGHSVCAVRFSPDGRTLASAGWDGTVKLWDLASARRLPVPAGKRQVRLDGFRAPLAAG